MIIRQAGIADAEAMSRILNEIIETRKYSAFDTPFTVEQEMEFIANFPKRGILHVAEEEDRSVWGFQTVEPFANYTHAFDHVGVIGTFVDLSRRRCGIGKRLAKATFRVAGEKGYEKFFAFVREDNPNALSFYGSLGFEVIGKARKQVRINGEYSDEFFMERLLE
jgi:L-amino acid N-acyltransferase YncA